MKKNLISASILSALVFIGLYLFLIVSGTSVNEENYPFQIILFSGIFALFTWIIYFSYFELSQRIGKKRGERIVSYAVAGVAIALAAYVLFSLWNIFVKS